MSGAPADALTGYTGSEAILLALEDATRSSRRSTPSARGFHHLLADLLQLELRRSEPAIIGSLCRAAARWFEEEGYVVDAIRHAQAAHDWAHAARLLSDNYVDLVFDGRNATLRTLLAAFPTDAREERAELLSRPPRADCMTAFSTRRRPISRPRKRLAGTVPDGRRRLFDLHLASARLWLACQRGDLTTARQAMDSFQAGSPDELRRSNDHRVSALMHLGIAELWSLHLDDARDQLEEALALARRIGRPYLEVGCLGHLALAAVLSGEPPASGCS